MGDYIVFSASVLTTVAIILITVLVSLSFQYVNYDQYALQKSTTTMKVQYDNVYDTGRYHWGVGHTTIPFSKLYRTIDFVQDSALSVFTSTGVNITIEVSFQSQIQKDYVVEIFQTYGTDYDFQVENIATSAIKNAAVQFAVSDYYLNRANISNAMFSNLRKDLAMIHTNVPNLQLRKVTFPGIISAQLLNAAITAQQTLEYQYQQLADIYRAGTQNLTTEITAQAQIVVSQGQAQISQIQAVAEAQAEGIRTSADGFGVDILFQSLNITSMPDKLEFLTLYRAAQNGELSGLFGLATSTVLLKV